MADHVAVQADESVPAEHAEAPADRATAAIAALASEAAESRAVAAASVLSVLGRDTTMQDAAATVQSAFRVSLSRRSSSRTSPSSDCRRSRQIKTFIIMIIIR